MTGVSRRGFLQTSVGTAAGVTAIGALTAASGLGAAMTSAQAAGEAKTVDEPVVAYVRRGSSDLTLMVGKREVDVRDPQLVRRLLDAAQ